MAAPRRILLAGVARSGKTQTAQRLQQALRLNHIQGDMLVACLGRTYPMFNWQYNSPHDWMCAQVEPFFGQYLQGLTDDANDSGIDYVFDTYYTMPEQVVRCGWNKTHQVLFFGYPAVTASEKLAAIRAYGAQHESDWTNAISDETLLPEIEWFIRLSKSIQAQCMLYGLPFIDTGKDFVAQLDEVYRRLMADF